MHNQRISQPKDIRADRRFDALVKKEMQEHQHLISSHNKEMQALREEFRLSLQKSEALSEKSQKELEELRDRAETHIRILKDKAAEQSLTIDEQKKAIDSLHAKLNSFHEIQASKDDMQKFKKDMESRITDSTMSSIVAFQNAQRDFKELFEWLKEELNKACGDLRKNIFDGMVSATEKFSQAQLDKEGIERELIRYKKDMFYIEKKIENIYTLIERINKRGELCRKQE
jgi:hypothetical protein